MTKNHFKSSFSALSMVFILTALCLLVSCSSHRPADVRERTNSSSKSLKTHTVTQGETLFSIAWRHGVDLQKLAIFNGIKPPYTIYPGQKIRININSTNKRILNPNGSTSWVAGNENASGNNESVSNDGRSKNRSKHENSTSNTRNFGSSVTWQWPGRGKLIASFLGDSSFSKGIDIGGKLGEPVLAAASGRVVYAGSGLSGYGKLLIIKHDEIFLSAYAHNHELLVKEGDFIKGGQRIADMGSSGTDRVKLHFEIRSEGSPVDPLKYLPKRY